MSFSAEEIAFMESHSLARLATVNSEGQPDVVPVYCEYDGEYFWIGGVGEVVLKTRKMRNIASGMDRVALVFDDLISVDPLIARGIRVYGIADAPIERVGKLGPGVYARIRPLDSWSWNLAGEPAGDQWYAMPHKRHSSTPNDS